jgi:hypothetical protein
MTTPVTPALRIIAAATHSQGWRSAPRRECSGSAAGAGTSNAPCQREAHVANRLRALLRTALQADPHYLTNPGRRFCR